jgi:uncharacterized membrane protein YcaP (DUF421 family)
MHLQAVAFAELWSHMFAMKDVIWLEKILRPVLVYFFLIIGLRLAGKRELAQLNAFDLIVLMTLSNTVQNAIIGDDNSVSGGMIGAATLLAVNYIMVRIAHRSRKIDRILEGRPQILMHNGQVDQDALHRELITKAELVAACHKQGLSSLHEVERCVLEPTGTITFVPRRPTTETSRHDEIMNMLARIAEEIRGQNKTPNTSAQ